jgi:hypothetical protein
MIPFAIPLLRTNHSAMKEMQGEYSKAENGCKRYGSIDK